MSFRVQLKPSANKKIISWQLPDPVLVDVHLRIQDLGTNPHWLVRVAAPFDGMVFPLMLIDPDNRFCEHAFFFHVRYAQDEECLLIVNAAYRKTVGI
jgi:hypothetical protein